MNFNTIRWVANKSSFLALGALIGIVLQKCLPASEWTAPIAVGVFMFATYVYAATPSGEATP